MFESLDEQMKKDEDRVTSHKQRMLRWAIYALAGVILMGGLIFGSLHLS
jgi:hypothetical protein